MTHQRPLDGGRLLKDFLVHERGITVLLGGGQVPVDGELPKVRCGARKRIDGVTVMGHNHHLILTQLDVLLRMCDKGADIARHEHLAVSDTYDQWRTTPGCNEH